MGETCCFCHRYLANHFFPLYDKYLNGIHQPCKDCWGKLDEKNKKLVVERLDKAVNKMKKEGSWHLDLTGIELKK